MVAHTIDAIRLQCNSVKHTPLTSTITFSSIPFKIDLCDVCEESNLEEADLRRKAIEREVLQGIDLLFFSYRSWIASMRPPAQCKLTRVFKPCLHQASYLVVVGVHYFAGLILIKLVLNQQSSEVMCFYYATTEFLTQCRKFYSPFDYVNGIGNINDIIATLLVAHQEALL